MDLRQLEFLSAIVKEGGFTKAAAKLFISQSAVSHKIRLLEQELGEPVFLRVGKRVILTPAGEALLRHSRPVFHHLKAVEAEMSARAGHQRGELSIGSTLTACVHILPPLLKKFRDKFPSIELRISIAMAEEIVPQIKQGRIDLGFLINPPVDKDLTIIKLFAEELVVAVSRDHPWAGRKYVRAAELSGVPFLTLTNRTRSRLILDAVFRDLHVSPNIIMELPYFTAIRSMIESSLGIGILPVSLLETGTRRPRLHALRIRGRRIYRELALVHLKLDFLPRPLAELVRFLDQEFRRMRR